LRDPTLRWAITVEINDDIVTGKEHSDRNRRRTIEIAVISCASGVAADPVSAAMDRYWTRKHHGGR